MMAAIRSFVCSLFFTAAILDIWPYVAALPVEMPTTTLPPVADNKTVEEWQTGLEYDRYLKEIVSVLENDEDFRKKMETADPEKFKTGEIAKELNFVSHNIRTKLDEIKRREMVRLRQLVKEQMEKKEYEQIKSPQHIDVGKEHFDEADLKKLILQATNDLQAADEARKKEFKEYELNKEHLRREKLARMDERTRQEEEKKIQEEEQKHKDHPKLHHPGSKAQLEEVWEKTDGLPKEDFNPKTFFMLHDLNQDGFLDIEELEALFQKELDKAYDPNRPEDDMRERSEEMARMREHVMREVDKNHDGLISLEEFMDEARKQSFESDPGWNTLEQEQPVWSEQDLREYERQLQMNPNAYANPYGNNYPNLPHPGYGYPPPQGYMPPGGFQQGVPNPNMGYPPQYQQQYPGGGMPQQPHYPPGGYPDQQQGFQGQPYQQQGYQQQGYQGGQQAYQAGQQQPPSYAPGGVGNTPAPLNNYQQQPPRNQPPQQQYQGQQQNQQQQPPVQANKVEDPNSIHSPNVVGGKQ